MPTRIYALAKELKLDSKELVEICARAGIPGKGSALASLSDQEVAKVKAYLAGEAKQPRAPASRAPAAGEKRPSPPPAPIKRDDYIPTRAPTRVRVLGAKPRPAGGEEEQKKKEDEQQEARPASAPKRREPREPVIKVAKLPEPKQPPPPPKPAEPKPQEPEIRLPKDAILGARKPLEQLAKAAKAKAKAKAKGETALDEEQADRAKGAKPGKGKRKLKDVEAADVGLAGMASARAERQRARRSRSRLREEHSFDEAEPGRLRTGRRRQTARQAASSAATAPRKGKVVLQLPCTVRTFSEAAGVPSAQIQRVLMGLGVMATINQQIEEEMVELVAAELGVELELRRPETLEVSVIKQLQEQEDDPALLVPRPPVVTFLGHVDHGKTSLLDRIAGTNIVSGEAGGITQHIRAYQVEKDGRKISFVDTPGHEAFTEMRARGANVTDIAVLVVAADDGVMPQTEEAISHAKAAGVPIVVALNKIDLPGADPNRVLTQLTEYGLTPSQWGGETEVVQTSAVTGQGVDELLETLLTLADLHEYRANPQRAALGVCLEAKQEAERGVIATLIVQKGTLRVGDVVVCGAAYGRIKALYDTLRPQARVTEAGPSTPVQAAGLDSAPDAGEAFYVLGDVSQAREIAASRAERTRARSLTKITTRISFEEFQRRLQEGRLGEQPEIVTLNLIIRADVRGSIEAILKELSKLEHPEVQVKVLQASVGGVTTADVALAHASHAVIIAFNVIPDEAARTLAEERQVEIRRYDVIYKVTDDIKALLEGKLKPEERIVELGRAVVKQVFPISRIGTVAGCYVVQGTLERGCRIRVNRDGRTIGDYELESLRREKDDVREVSRGYECGVKLAGFNDVKKDDILEAYKVEEVARSL